MRVACGCLWLAAVGCGSLSGCGGLQVAVEGCGGGCVGGCARGWLKRDRPLGGASQVDRRRRGAALRRHTSRACHGSACQSCSACIADTSRIPPSGTRYLLVELGLPGVRVEVVLRLVVLGDLLQGTVELRCDMPRSTLSCMAAAAEALTEAGILRALPFLTACTTKLKLGDTMGWLAPALAGVNVMADAVAPPSLPDPESSRRDRRDVKQEDI